MGILNSKNNTPTQIKQSAKLNIGKSYPKILKSRKSTTSCLVSLSIKLPIAPPYIKAKVLLSKLDKVFFCLNR